MGLSTLNGHRVTSARATIPAWGAWYAEASTDDEVALSGAVELKIADLTLRGTVVSGGPSKGRSDFRIVAGAGGWGKSIPKKSYANDAGVKVSTVLGDAAALVGETFAAAGSDRTGPAWTRKEGRAGRLLEQLAPSAWYIDEAGVTRLGKRPAVPLAAAVVHGPVDRARGTVTLAAESIAAILPGLVVDGLEAVDVLHEVSANGGLRSTIWGKQGSGTSRVLAAFRDMLDQLDPDRAFRGVTEYRVVTVAGERVNLQPVRVSTGMPDLPRVLARPGVPGAKAMLLPGARVLVGFADSSPARPYIAAFEDAEGEGFKPVSLSVDAQALIEIGAGAVVTKLGLGVRPAIGAGDFAGPFPVAPTQVKVLI